MISECKYNSLFKKWFGEFFSFSLKVFLTIQLVFAICLAQKTDVKMYICPNMDQPADFFAEFPPVSKEAWLARITKDLKGKPLDELYWQLNEGIRIDPFGHADDRPVPPVPLLQMPEFWEINEDVDEREAADGNIQALDALRSGVTSLRFRIPVRQLSEVLPLLLDGIYLDHISLHFCGDGVEEAPAAVLAALKGISQGISSPTLRGSLFYDPAADRERLRDWRYLADLLQFARSDFPGFRCISVDGHPAFKGPAGAADELASLLQRGQAYFENLTKAGISADHVAAQMQFSMLAGKSYFVEIAKLRAFKILWVNYLKAWGVAPAYPLTDVRLFPGDYTADLYGNMIRATTMAMSAVLGGANRLTVLPYDAGYEGQADYPRNFSRRIARNVQHLLQLESGFSELPDPAAGSYYLEKLTAQLAAAAWEKFQNL